MAKKSLVKKAPKETSKKVASNAPAPFDAKNLAHSAIYEHAEKREHVGSFISVERMIERRDRGHQLEWFAKRENFAGLALGRNVAVENLAPVAQRLHRSGLQHVSGSADFVAGLANA